MAAAEQATRTSSSRFHCNHCGQPVSRENWLRITYAYRGGNASYLACPTCLTTQLVLPVGPGDAPPPSHLS